VSDFTLLKVGRSFSSAVAVIIFLRGDF